MLFATLGSMIPISILTLMGLYDITLRGFCSLWNCYLTTKVVAKYDPTIAMTWSTARKIFSTFWRFISLIVPVFSVWPGNVWDNAIILWVEAHKTLSVFQCNFSVLYYFCAEEISLPRCQYTGPNLLNVAHICRIYTVYPKKYAQGYCFAVLCCGYTLTDFPISIRLTSLALWQSNDCPSASKATLMNMDKYFMWIHHERLHNHNKAKHNKTVCIFLGIYYI